MLQIIKGLINNKSHVLKEIGEEGYQNLTISDSCHFYTCKLSRTDIIFSSTGGFLLKSNL